MIVAIDFDGVLCQDQFPAIGPPNEGIVHAALQAQLSGHTLVLWTSRCGERLIEAVKWCEDQCLEFEHINMCPVDGVKKYGYDPRKIFADLYVDDRGVGFTLKAAEQVLLRLACTPV